MVAEEIAEINAGFPNLLPPFSRDDFFLHDVGRGAYFDAEGLKLYVKRALGHLTAALEQTEGAPVTQKREFVYVADNDVRRIVVRDYSEAQRAFVARCWKSVIILAGGLIEALLLGLLEELVSSFAKTLRLERKKRGSRSKSSISWTETCHEPNA